jgi:hypothetical protein
MKQLTIAQLAALNRVCDAMAAIVNDHPEGIPGGHLYAPIMANMSLDNFNAMMSALVVTGKVTKRGECYYPSGEAKMRAGMARAKARQ